MAIQLMCSRCGKPSTADNSMVGERVACPHCDAMIAVPMPGAGIKTSRGTVYNPTVAAAAKAQRDRARWTESARDPGTARLGKIIAIAAAVIFMVLITLSVRSGSRGSGGRKAQAAELYGHWVHKGSNLTVELNLKANGTYERWPKNYELVGAGIEESGSWRLDPDGAIVFTPSGGSYYPYISGSRLNFRHQVNNRVYTFTRKAS